MAVGRRLGNYDIDREIGRGGMGAVYVGKHQLLGRTAAVKILQPHYSKDQDVVKRFFNEARAATAIRHPSIVEIFDFGFADDGSAFIVMELCDGESLATRLRRTRILPTSVALAITRQIAGALAAAHKAGIVHRDLKPDNVFLVPDPEVIGGERIKLLDFGIAKLAGDANNPSATQTGAILGTPYYMSPEQCRGAGHVDHRADLYSLGCILFEMVCGRVPFVGEGPGDIIGAHLHIAPPKPSAMAPQLPTNVEALILSLLAKKADERPARADLVVASIHAIAGTSPQPSRDDIALVSTAAGSEPGKQPSPAIAFGDTVGSSPKIAAPSAIGSSPGLDSTQPSGASRGIDSTQPSGSSPGVESTQPGSAPGVALASVPLIMEPSDLPPAVEPHLAMGTPAVVHVAPTRVTARMSAQMPPMPRGQKLITFVLVLAAIGAGAAAVLARPQLPTRVPHKVGVVESSPADLSVTEVQLNLLDPSRPGDPPLIRATVIRGPQDPRPEEFTLVEPDSTVPATMPALNVLPLSASNDSISIAVLVQGTESWIGFGATDRDDADGEQRSFDVLKTLNTAFSRADWARLPSDTEITFLEYSEGTSARDTHKVSEMDKAPLGAANRYLGKRGVDLAFGATRAISTLKSSYASRKFLIVIGDGTDSNDESAKVAFSDLKRDAANANIKMFGVVYKTAGSYTDTVLRSLIPGAQTINSIDGFAASIAAILGRIDDRYYVTFPTYEPKENYGLSLDGAEHDLTVRIGGEDTEAVSLTLPRWHPPLGKPTRSVILGGMSIALLLVAAGLARRSRRQRQLLAIPRA